MARKYNLMSSDGHLEVPPERWTHRVPQKYRDRAPHTVHLPDGGDALMIEGQPLLEANFLDLRAGRAEGTWQPFGLKVADAAGTGSPEQRIKEQDRDGMDAEVLFAAMVAGPVFWRNISHDEVYKAVIRGYNDWLAEEYCAVAPDRLIGMGVIPITNVDDAIAEMAHCKKLGLKGILMGALPSAKGYPTPEDDKFWAAAVDMDMPVTVHVQFYRTGARATQPTFKYPKEDPVIMQRLRRPFLEWLCNFGLAPSVSIAQLVLAGVFERHPKLKIFFAETRLGWVPFWLEHMDLWYQRHLGWAQEYLGFQPLKGIAEPLRAQPRLFQRAVRARRGRRAPACGRRPHHVRHRLPAYRMRVAQFAPADRQDLRRYPGSRQTADLGRQLRRILPSRPGRVTKLSSAARGSFLTKRNLFS